MAFGHQVSPLCVQALPHPDEPEEPQGSLLPPCRYSQPTSFPGAQPMGFHYPNLNLPLIQWQQQGLPFLGQQLLPRLCTVKEEKPSPCRENHRSSWETAFFVLLQVSEPFSLVHKEMGLKLHPGKQSLTEQQGALEGGQNTRYLIKAPSPARRVHPSAGGSRSPPALPLEAPELVQSSTAAAPAHR